MKLIRFGMPGAEKPGVKIDNIVYDISAFGEDYTPQFFANDGIERLQEFVNKNGKDLPVVAEPFRYGPPLVNSSKIVCIGLNYVDHAKETLAPTPVEPIIFFKATSAIVGPNDDVIIPKGSTKTDWEVELAIIIGKKANYVAEADALDYVAGYCLHNDYSERAFQLERGGQWVKGKSCDTFAPIGPELVTKDEVPDVHNLRLWLSVNGQMMQDGNTSNMIFKVAHIVSYLSQFMSLMPGDIISTGTPAGVGLGLKPEPVYLKPGDVVELGIDGMGTSKQKMVAWQ